MPAAAVIPAPKAYINVVAVKKLVVDHLSAWAFGLARTQALIGPNALSSLISRLGPSDTLLRKN